MKLTAKKIIFFFPIVLISFFVFLKIAFNEIYISIIQEDNFVENAEVFLYFISSIFAISISFSFFKVKLNIYGIGYLTLFFALVFVCGEEISWGQRMFGIQSPGFFVEHNVQKEINLHNLYIFHNPVYLLYLLVGFYGAFTHLFLSRKIKTRYNFMVGFFVPDWFLMFWFMPVFIVYLCYCIYGFSILFLGIKHFNIGDGFFIVWRDQEPAEFLMALGIFFFTVLRRKVVTQYFHGKAKTALYSNNPSGIRFKTTV